MRTGLVALLILLIALAWFNPDMADFKLFIKDRTVQLLQNETGDSDVGSAIAALGGSLAGTYVDRITEHTNYFVFSTYTLDLDGTGEEANEWRFVGIAGTFIETHKPAFLDERRE